MKRKRKTTCSKCGNELEINRIGKYRYCKACHSEYTRNNRPKHSELSPLQRTKANARSYLNVYIHRGKIVPQPCEVCSTTINVQAHHDDYSKPLEVRWLCPLHHLELHKYKKELPNN